MSADNDHNCECSVCAERYREIERLRAEFEQWRKTAIAWQAFGERAHAALTELHAAMPGQSK